MTPSYKILHCGCTHSRSVCKSENILLESKSKLKVLKGKSSCNRKSKLSKMSNHLLPCISYLGMKFLSHCLRDHLLLFQDWRYVLNIGLTNWIMAMIIIKHYWIAVDLVLLF